MIKITNANIHTIEYVLQNLRALDRAELEAVGSDLERLKFTIMRQRVFAYCAEDERGPISVWGMLKLRDGVGAGFAFGTDEWGAALLPMIRQIRGFVLPLLRTTGIHRVDAVALAHRHDIKQFMALIGARPEGLLRGYGCRGEDFISYRWLADEYRGEKRRAVVDLLHANAAR